MANRDIVWNYCTAVGINKKKTKCNYCHKEISGGGVTRMKEHLAAMAGDVAPCPNVPKEVRKLIREHLIKKRNERSQGKLEKQRVQEELMSMPEQQNSDVGSDGNEDDRDIQHAFQASKESYISDERRRSGVGSSGVKRTDRSKSLRVDNDFEIRAASRIDSYVQTRGGRSQPSIKTAIKGIKDAKKHIGRAISKKIYFNHIAHNAASSPYYQTMVDAIAEAGHGVKPPTPGELSKTYLDLECAEIKQHIDTYSKFWDEYGCTLMCDGWSTQNRRKIINFLVYSTQGTVFLKSVDATDKFQSAQYICGLMDNVVNFIGEDRIVQIVTDNGANYKAAGQLLMEKRRQLYWTPCAAHCIDLILEDISKEAEVKIIISNCQSITGFIYNHGWLLTIMRKETNNKELIRPAVTRFATHFIALEFIYTHKENLRRMIYSREWSAKIPKLGPKDKKTAILVYNLIHSDKFWANIAAIILVFGPLVKVLRMVDNDDKAEMGYLYEAMDRAKELIKKNIGSRQYQRWWNIIDKRWERQLHRPIHAAGYFLNPQIQYGDKATNDDEVLNGWTNILERMVPDIAMQIEISKEVEKYRMKLGVFGSAKAKQAVKSCLPAMWWSIIGREDAPNLTHLAMRILSQTVSSSNCERNWTTFAMIHTKLRNRIKMENLEKLVFVHYNMRLRVRHAKRQQTTDQLIDLDYIFHEEDPLAEWTREAENPLLDNASDNPWSDNDNASAENTENDSSSNDDSGNAGGDGIGSSGYGVGSTFDDSQRHIQNYEEDDYSRRRDRNLNVVHEDQGDYDGRYISNNVPSFRYSTSDYTGGYSYCGLNQPYADEPSNSQDEPSPFDNMMTTFLSSDQIQQYTFSTYYNPSQDEESDEQNLHDAQRNSFWY